MGKCLDDLRANYSRGLTDAEIEEIFADAKRLWKGVQASKQASNQNALAQQLAKQQAEREQIAAVIKKRNTYLQLERFWKTLWATGKGVRLKGFRPCWSAAKSCGKARA